VTPEEAQAAVVSHWRQKAAEALASARSELAAGRFDFAVNRAYYAAFYAASAALLARGKRFVRHQGLRACIHRDLVRGGDLSAEWGRAFDRLFDSRLMADYQELARFDAGRASELVEQARGFVEQMARLTPGQINRHMSAGC
jgi:uncharacterized protein (UPF0332 family)